MENGVNNKTLCAFYDFALSRISFDYFGFLVLAEFTRKARNLEVLHLVLVPAEGDGFHPNVLYDLDQKQWRLRQIVMLGLALIPGRTQLTLCNSRQDAQEIYENADTGVFPEYYKPDRPIAKWHCSWSTLYGALGKDLQVLRGTTQALTYVENWLNTQDLGRGLISITLRNASFNTHKNTSDILWAKVANGIKEMGFLPVLVPDTETALLDPEPSFDGLCEMPEAAMNIEIRMALYELSFLNLCVSNGAAALCHFNKFAKFIQFVSGDYLVDKIHAEADTGLPFGKTSPYLNHFQKMVWREHTFENILAEVKLMASKIEDASDAKQINQCYKVNHDYSISLIEILRLALRTNNWELFNETSKELLKTEQDRAETHYLIGCAELKKENTSQNGLPEMAREALSEAVRIGKKEIVPYKLTYSLCEVVGKGLELLGRQKEAQEFLEQCLEHKPDFFLPYKLLAKIYVSCQKNEQAIECYAQAIENGVSESALYLGLGEMLTTIGRLDDAINCFQHLITVGTKDVEVYLNIGLLHEAQNNFKAAIVAYEKAIDIKQDERILYRLNRALEEDRNLKITL